MRPDGHDARVMVVDDEEDVRDMIAAVLDAEGYDVTAMPDGESAVAAVRAAHFDLVVLDLRMPGMSGQETLAALRAIDPDLVVIIASGYATFEERAECLALGAEILMKPFSIADLVSVIERALENRAEVAHGAEPAAPR